MKAMVGSWFRRELGKNEQNVLLKSCSDFMLCNVLVICSEAVIRIIPNIL